MDAPVARVGQQLLRWLLAVADNPILPRSDGGGHAAHRRSLTTRLTVAGETPNSRAIVRCISPAACRSRISRAASIESFAWTLLSPRSDGCRARPLLIMSA